MKKILLLSFLGFGFLNLNAQNPLTDDSNQDHGVIYPEYMKISRPLREIWAEENADPNAPTEFEIKNEEAPDKRMGKREAQPFDFTLKTQGIEFKNDENFIQKEDGTRPNDNTMKANFAGIGSGGAFPYDPSGAAGPNHYIQAVNATTYRIFNKTTGANLGGGSVGSIWSPATGNMGDPIIMYDRFADRWFISQFGQSGSTNYIYIAISTTADPLGTYYTYSFTSPQFPDYLKFAVWHDGYYMTANTNTQRVFCFERSVMLTGGTARSVYASFTPPDPGGFFVPMPGDCDGTTISTGPCPIFSYECGEWGGGMTDQINVYQATVTWGATPAMNIAAATGSPLNTAAFDGTYDLNWDDIDQPGTTQMLDGIGGIIQYRAQYRKWSTHNSVVLCWPVQISTGERSIMWAELRQTAGTWAVYQQGIYDPDAYYRWVGSIAMDDNGNIALCYAKSGVSPTNVYPSLCYTGRLSTDPLGQMTFAETVAQAGTGYQTGANRFGDYAQTTLDPDGMTFWHTGQYNGGASGPGVQRTRIYSFQLQTVLNAAVSITSNDADNSICNGTSVTFTATPTNGGSSPSYQWKKNGGNVGTNSNTYTTTTLANGDFITCVMTSNLSGVGNNPATSNAITMTVNNPVTPAVSIVSNDADNSICSGTSVAFTATPTNGGTPSYQWKKNGSNVGSNSATYTTTTLANGDIINVVMTSTAACASPTTGTSNSITMTVIPSVTPSVSIAGDNTICLDAATTFTATPTNGGTPSYQWKKNGGNVGTNSSTFTSSTLANGDVITCVMTSTATCPSPTTATSNSLTMTVTTVTTPTITQNGGILTSSSATGNQWYLDGNLLVGETNQSITVTQSGVYTVQVTINGCTSNMSAGNNATVGIDEANNPYLLVTFPNPSDGNFMISFNADRNEKYKLELFNEIGQVIVSQEIAGHQGTYQLPVNLVKPAAGVYTLSLTNGQQETVKKIVVY
jgi:hypothetical protein